MLNFKNIVVIFGIGAVASTNAQQVIKNISGNIVKQFALGNGTALPTISGPNNISVGQSSEGGTLVVRAAGATSNISLQTTSNINTTIPSENIAGNTVNRTPGNTTQSTSSTPTGSAVSLNFTRKNARADTNSDGAIDGIMTSRELPTLQTNSTAIPVGTKVRMTSATLASSSGGPLLSTSDIWLNRNGINRENMTIRPDGSATPILEDRGTFMGVEDFSIYGKASIYPNPAIGPITIQTNNPNDKKVEIYDLSGQIVARMPISGESSEIDISQLSTGPYIITTQDTDGNKTVSKLIKK